MTTISALDALEALSNDELADGICTWAGRVAAGEAELLRWIAEFDRREAWAGPGLLSCAHWLSWRIGLSPGAARERVRIARALSDLPEVAEAFGGGRISYSQVRAITRAAAPEDQQRWIDLARSATAGQLEKTSPRRHVLHRPRWRRPHPQTATSTTDPRQAGVRPWRRPSWPWRAASSTSRTR